MRVKTLHKITHAQASRQVANSNKRNQTSLSSSRLVETLYDSSFPRLPSTSGKSTVSYKSISENQNEVQDMQTADIETAQNLTNNLFPCTFKHSFWLSFFKN